MMNMFRKNKNKSETNGKKKSSSKEPVMKQVVHVQTPTRHPILKLKVGFRLYI